ncbi:hypothetical protein [Frigoribacterium sp. Leaf186]|uniref:hypothetical protein n=1 Tax=Frigoribacterium sp. Leaf186 TaxID=1736293 RepID=UPI0006F620FE|nr:hypothetical protein [Frigoribacterium sp. Leaf186]KQS22381.1 hypothetical protein ASG05_01960 [Frigoribacterium sp. Leaf186]
MAGKSPRGRHNGDYRVLQTAGAAEREELIAVLRDHLKGIDLRLVLEAVGGIEGLAKRMLASVPGVNVYDDALAPFYDTTSLGRWKGIRRKSIDGQVRRGDVLCVTTSDSHRLYPSFQFDGPDGTPLPDLAGVLAVLDPRRVDVWGDAIWVREPHAELGDRSPAQALRDGDADDVIALARQAGALLAS